MADEHLEQRSCARFRIPGATVAYRKAEKPGKPIDYKEEFLPLLDVSRGGIRFLCQELLKLDARLHLKIQVPGDSYPLAMEGTVRWYGANPGQSYKYQIGVQFLPYGEKKDMNYPGNLVKIIAYEQKFMDETTVIKDETGGRGSTFTI